MMQILTFVKEQRHASAKLVLTSQQILSFVLQYKGYNFPCLLLENTVLHDVYANIMGTKCAITHIHYTSKEE